MSKHTYTKVPLPIAMTYVLACNDCGADHIGGVESDIVHHKTCKPTDLNYFMLTDKERRELKDELEEYGDV